MDYMGVVGLAVPSGGPSESSLTQHFLRRSGLLFEAEVGPGTFHVGLSASSATFYLLRLWFCRHGKAHTSYFREILERTEARREYAENDGIHQLWLLWEE